MPGDRILTTRRGDKNFHVSIDDSFIQANNTGFVGLFEDQHRSLITEISLRFPILAEHGHLEEIDERIQIHSSSQGEDSGLDGARLDDV